MKHVRTLVAVAALLACVGLIACGDTKSTSEVVPVSPSSTPPPTSAALTAPAPDSPVADVVTTSLRPTLTVRNGTSSVPGGARTYEFQVSDRSDFTFTGGTFSAYYVVVANKTGVVEDPSGKTSYTVESDLQPATKMYWRSRMSQDSVTSNWSETASFRTRIAGYNRAGELYDPLVYGDTVGERIGDTSFVQGKGIRLNTGTSFVRYRLPETIPVGEFSVEVEGLKPDVPVTPGMVNKPKIFAMQDGDGDYSSNAYRADVQYRGLEGNPPNCIQFKALFGGERYKIEPATEVRWASVFFLDPAKTYFWKASWNRGFRLEVSEGINGFKFYDQALSVAASYSPARHVAYLGAPVGSDGEMAVIVGATYRNVWLSKNPRPASLGSAIEREF